MALKKTPGKGITAPAKPLRRKTRSSPPPPTRARKPANLPPDGARTGRASPPAAVASRKAVAALAVSAVALAGRGRHDFALPKGVSGERRVDPFHLERESNPPLRVLSPMLYPLSYPVRRERESTPRSLSRVSCRQLGHRAWHNACSHSVSGTPPSHPGKPGGDGAGGRSLCRLS